MGAAAGIPHTFDTLTAKSIVTQGISAIELEGLHPLKQTEHELLRSAQGDPGGTALFQDWKPADVIGTISRTFGEADITQPLRPQCSLSGEYLAAYDLVIPASMTRQAIQACSEPDGLFNVC